MSVQFFMRLEYVLMRKCADTYELLRNEKDIQEKKVTVQENKYEIVSQTEKSKLKDRKKIS